MSSAKRPLHEMFTKWQTTKTKPIPAAAAESSAGETRTQLRKTRRRSSASGESRNTLKKASKKFIKFCQNRRFRYDKATYTLTVRRLAAAKQFNIIEDILGRQKKYDEIRSEGFSSRLIFLYGKSSMYDHARKLFDELPELNCPRGVKSFNALLKAGLDSYKLDAVVEAFKELPSQLSIKPDLISYNIVIHALCQMGDLEGALSMKSELEENGREPDLITFNTLLNALYKNGRFSEGESLFSAMVSKNLVPDVHSYNAKLRGMFHENGEMKVDEVVNEMVSKGIRPDLFSYNSLIYGYCQRGDLKEAMKWYNKIQKSEYAPNLFTFRMLIPACTKRDDYDTALELCVEAVNLRLLLKASLFQDVVDGLFKELKLDEALMLLNLVASAKHLNYKLTSRAV